MMNNTLRPAKAALSFALAMAAFTAAAIPARTASNPAEALSLLHTATGGALTSRTNAIDAYATVHALPGAVLLADNAAAAPLARAQNFLSSYGVLAGVSDAVNQLALQRISPDRAGNTHVHLNQVERGLPVFGARLVVHMNSQGVTGMNGVFISGLEALSLTPAKSVAELRQRAFAAGRKLYPEQTLAVQSSRMMFYRSGLLKGVETQKNHLAYEVMLQGGTPAKPIRERIILDANTGYLINRVNEIHTTLNREIYTPNQDVPPVLTEGSAIAPADEPLMLDDRAATSSRAPFVAAQPVPAVNNLYFYAGGTHDLYSNLFGVSGYDFTRPPEAGQVQKSVYLVNDACPNAYWNGDSTNYCPGFDADDVVSHEWSHAYTEYTSGLVYQYQSGALNEGYSDIFGETYDLVNRREGMLGANLPESDYYKDGGSRWVVGEDLTEEAALALLRDMWDPDDFGFVPGTTTPVLNGPSPGSVITSANYFCGTGDNGGVHTNSGVPNHAYAMLVDGRPNAIDPSVYNNIEVPAIGMTKAAHIYFQAQNNYQTPTTNFNQHADALERSCNDLLGAPLNDVTGSPSIEKITPADCAAVTAAIAAVEMRINPKEKCGYVTVLLPEAGTPASCPTGEFVFPTFKETWEGGSIPADWTGFQNLAGDTEPQPFEWGVTDAPAPHTGKSAWFDNNGFGTCAPGGDASSSTGLDSPEIIVPEDASFLSFTHLMQSEAGFDGGNLKYSIDGAAFAIVPAEAFSYNGHSAAFIDAPLFPGDPILGGNNTSPLAGEAAWTGSDQGEATGSWGTTVVNIAELGASKGQKIKFRWEFGQDGCGGNLGWFVDDTQVFYCSKTAPVTPTDPVTPTVPPVNPAPVATATGTGRFGGGAFGLLALLPLAALALRRRRLHY